MEDCANIVDEFIRTLEEAIRNFEQCQVVQSAPELARCREKTVRLKQEADRLFEEYRSSGS